MYREREEETKTSVQRREQMDVEVSVRRQTRNGGKQYPKGAASLICRHQFCGSKIQSCCTLRLAAGFTRTVTFVLAATRHSLWYGCFRSVRKGPAAGRTSILRLGPHLVRMKSVCNQRQYHQRGRQASVRTFPTLNSRPSRQETGWTGTT